MTWAHQGNRGTVAAKAASTTTVVSVTATVAVGRVLVVHVATDNLGNTAGATSHISSVADSQGNSYSKVSEYTQTGGSSADGVTVAIYVSKIATQLTTSDTVTVTHPNVVARTAGLEEYSISGTGISVAGNNGAIGSGTSGSVTLSGLASAEYLWVGQFGFEDKSNVTFTGDTDYSYRTQHSTGTGGAGAANITGNPADRVYSGASDTFEFSSLSTSSDFAIVLGALQETGGGPTYTLTAAYGSFTQTGQASGTLFNRVISAGQGSFGLTGQAAGTLFNRMIGAGQGSFTLTGEEAALLLQRLLGASQGSFTLSGQTVDLVYTPVTADPPGYLLDDTYWPQTYAYWPMEYEYWPVAGVGGPTYTLTAEYGSFSMGGQASGTLFNRLIAALQGSFTLTGEASGLLFNRMLDADQGGFTLSGQAAGLLFHRLLGAGQGSFTLSGQAAGLLFNRLIGAEQGSFTLSGQASGLLYNRLLAAAQGSFVLSGQAVELVYSGGAATYTLIASQGSFALSGTSAGLLANRLLAAAQGSFTLTGEAADLLRGFHLDAGQGSFILSGQDADLIAARLMQAGLGSFALGGQASGLLHNRLLVAGQGAFVLSGQDAAQLYHRILSATQGSFTVTGIAVNFDYSGSVIGMVVELQDEAAFLVVLSDQVVYAVQLSDQAAYAAELSDEIPQ